MKRSSTDEKIYLTHKIALCPTPDQVTYFKRACGTARRVWNWALDEWNKQYKNLSFYKAGSTPNEMALKLKEQLTHINRKELLKDINGKVSSLQKQFNGVKYDLWPWLKEIHRHAHSRPFAHLSKALRKFFADIKDGKTAHAPRFKKQGRCRDSFYVANDAFKLNGKIIDLPKIRKVTMTEKLRFSGKILGATVSRTADRWYVSIHVKVPSEQFYLQRTAHAVVGVDLGVKAIATLSSGEKFNAPKPLASALRRLRIRNRRLSRKIKGSNNYKKAQAELATLHARIANIRTDCLHKLTTHICRKTKQVVIEDLNVKGMMANHTLSRAINDVGLGKFRELLEYKSKRYGTELIVADPFYPSSRLCSVCGYKNNALTLSDREWDCPQCGTHHDRDINAARNLEQLATKGGTVIQKASTTVGKRRMQAKRRRTSVPTQFPRP